MQHIGKQVEERFRNIEFAQADPITLHGSTQVPNFCFPGQQRWADDLDMSIGSINDFIKELEKADLVEIARRGQGKTNYKINFMVQKKPNRLKS